MALLSVAASPSTEFSGRSGSSNYSFSACMHSSVIVGQYGGRLPFPRRPRPFVPPFEFFTTPGVCNSHVGTWGSDAPGDICHTDAPVSHCCVRQIPWVLLGHWPPLYPAQIGYSVLLWMYFPSCMLCTAGAVRVAGSDLLLICHPCWSRRGLSLPWWGWWGSTHLRIAFNNFSRRVVLAHSPLLSKRLRLTQPAPRLNSRVCSRHSQWCRLLRLELSPSISPCAPDDTSHPPGKSLTRLWGRSALPCVRYVIFISVNGPGPLRRSWRARWGARCSSAARCQGCSEHRDIELYCSQGTISLSMLYPETLIRFIRPTHRGEMDQPPDNCSAVGSQSLAGLSPAPKTVS